MVFGLLLFLAGGGLALWAARWLPLLFALVGIYGIWRALKRLCRPGQQLKIGKQGIWTPKTGALSWKQATLRLESHVGYRGGASTSLIIASRASPHLPLGRFRIDELDIDGRMIPIILQKFT